MSIDSLRKMSRRGHMRRQDERRMILYDFGSSKWLKMIKEHYFLWPKEDRRARARREIERREIERRQYDAGRVLLSKQLDETVEQLTDEEKLYLNTIWNS